jgi:hypothetical protein
METKVLVFVELAAGIVLGFMAWSYISPMLSSVSATPSA